MVVVRVTVFFEMSTLGLVTSSWSHAALFRVMAALELEHLEARFPLSEGPTLVSPSTLTGMRHLEDCREEAREPEMPSRAAGCFHTGS